MQIAVSEVLRGLDPKAALSLYASSVSLARSITGKEFEGESHERMRFTIELSGLNTSQASHLPSSTRASLKSSAMSTKLSQGTTATQGHHSRSMW